MDLEGITPSEISQMEKDKNYDSTHTRDVKQKAKDEQTKQTTAGSWTQTMEWWLPQGKVDGRGWIGGRGSSSR